MKDRKKARWDLIPWGVLGEAVDIMTDGVDKHGDNKSWLEEPDAEAMYWSALHRHLSAYWLGEETDEDSGKAHLAHALCTVFILRDIEMNREGAGIDCQTEMDLLKGRTDAESLSLTSEQGDRYPSRGSD